MALSAPEVIFATSRTTAELLAAAISSFPSCVRVMPAGAGRPGTTRTISMRPPLRFSTAMPPFAPAKDAKTQQPSELGTTANGFEGSVKVTVGELSGALQLLGWA